MKIIVSCSIYIRLLLPNDDVDLYNLLNDNREHFKVWLPWLELVNTLSDAQTFIETAVYRHNALESSSFGVFYEDTLVGVAGFNSFDYQNKQATIGYWLAKSHIGKGIISQVVNTLLDYGFNDQGLNKIEIRCAEQNLKSREIPVRLNFTYEATLRQCEWLYDKYVDHAVYSLLASEYKSLNSHK